MIVGLGTDIVQISRIRQIVDGASGDKFLARCFTAVEIERSQSKHDPAAAFARLYAAKEAALKAIGTGMREGLAWHDFEVIHTDLGAPIICITGGAKLVLQEKSRYAVIPHLSLSDDGDYAVATVIIETDN